MTSSAAAGTLLASHELVLPSQPHPGGFRTGLPLCGLHCKHSAQQPRAPASLSTPQTPDSKVLVPDAPEKG